MRRLCPGCWTAAAPGNTSKPVRPGDRITMVRRLESLTEREGRLGVMILGVYVVEYTNQDGVLVATQRSTIIRH